MQNNNRSRIDKNFLSEIRKINNQDIQQFTINTLLRAPEYFWNIASSSSGKYHPADENCAGGLVIHIKKAFKVGEDLCREFNISGDDRDCILSALLLHDITHHGYPNDLGYCIHGHGCAFYTMFSGKEEFEYISNNKNFKKIAKLIVTHMSHWDFPFENGVETGDILQIIVQSSDYIASRSYININIKE